jgi:hypothetical protein
MNAAALATGSTPRDLSYDLLKIAADCLAKALYDGVYTSPDALLEDFARALSTRADDVRNLGLKADLKKIQARLEVGIEEKLVS